MEKSKVILWTNKFICIDRWQKLSYGTSNLFVSIGDKSVYFRNFAEKGILRVGDLISNKMNL